MTKNIITDYLKAQIKRNYDNKNYFVDGNDFLDTGLVSYPNYTNDKLAFYDLCDDWFKGSEYEGLLGLQLFVVQNLRMPNHMYGLNRVSYNTPSDDEIITVLTHEDLLIGVAFDLMVRRYIYNHYADLFDNDDLFYKEDLLELANKL